MQIRYLITLFYLSLFTLIFSCKKKIDSNSSQIALNDIHKPSKSFSQEDTKSDTRALLDSLSKKVEIPYGNSKVKEIDFPKQWYCGGGYLDGSLKKKGFSNLDSIKYAKDFFSILDSQIDTDFDKDKKFSLKILNSKRTIFSKHYSPTKKDSIYNSFYPYIKLPDYENNSVYGIIIRNGNRNFNLVFFLVDSDNNITDYLTSFKLSKSSMMIEKAVYIDANYIFTSNSFYILDGYEVETGIKEHFKIQNGKFVKYHKQNGVFNSKSASGKVENNVRVGKWKEYTYQYGRSTPIYYLESSYNKGLKDGMWSYYNIDEAFKKTKLRYIETYKDNELVKKEIIKNNDNK